MDRLIMDEYVGVMTLEGHFWVKLIIRKGIEGSGIEWRSNFVIIRKDGVSKASSWVM